MALITTNVQTGSLPVMPVNYYTWANVSSQYCTTALTSNPEDAMTTNIVYCIINSWSAEEGKVNLLFTNKTQQN